MNRAIARVYALFKTAWWRQKQADWHEDGIYRVAADMSAYQWHKFFKSTMAQVEVCRRRVRVGFQVDDCQGFARYLRMSGIIDLMGIFQSHVTVLKSFFRIRSLS